VLFKAGDPDSLAHVLTELLQDPQRCRQLADKGAAWVRANRTWAANATTYLKVYEQIGGIQFGELRVAQAAIGDADVEALRDTIRGREPIPLEMLADGDARDDADWVINNGWSPGGHDHVKLELPIDWATLWTGNRTWNFRLHSWNFMGPVLTAYAKSGHRPYLDWCIDRAVSWAESFNEGDPEPGVMAWYDMALGARCHRLAYLVEQAILHGVEERKLTILLACVLRHQKELFADRAFNPRNNHGVYVALGQLALARRLSTLPAMDVMRTQGNQRLEHMVKTQFAPDGGHLEHSPEYHDMLLGSFTEAMRAGLLNGDSIGHRIKLAEDVLGWFVQPNGELAQVGDSQALQLRHNPSNTSATTRFHLSQGREGTPDVRRLLVLPESGYAIVRAPQPLGTNDFDQAGHLLLAAGFHSRAHKHADDLTLTWFDRGREILIDAGRYGYIDLLPQDSPLRLQGYFYGAPERQYVESTRAHNTVEADGADHARRGRKPYGSALIDGIEREGHFRLRAEVNHGHWRHHRTVIYLPGQWMLVSDRVGSQDETEHDFRSWWNFAADAEFREDGDGAMAIALPGTKEALWVTQWGGACLIGPVSGAKEPLRGWRSRMDLNFEPAWSMGYEAAGVREHTFTTLFQFSGDRPPTTPDHPFES
ncbi:MAG TPA: heparinase II/III family protein, partial [Candidatus Limnocylindrales bacterium]|nr:heparinase II/III family protein [Candidatus Limnocylindrales bacterium]